jgi:uncharacterized protein YkwD
VNSCLQDEAVLQAVIYPVSSQDSQPHLDGNGQKSAFLQDLLDRINQVRATVPVPPLARIQLLENAAQGYSQTLIGTDPTNLSHDVGGTTPADRVNTAGYDQTAAVGENLAAGQWSAQEVINAWTSNPDLYANLINPNFTQVGLGLAGGPTGSDTFVLYWVADFGGSAVSFDPPGGGGTPLDVRGAVAQLHSYLQQADAALCAGDASAVDAALGQGGFVDYWRSVGLVGDSTPLTMGVANCLNGVLGFYSATTGVNYTTTTSYITAYLING